MSATAMVAVVLSGPSSQAEEITLRSGTVIRAPVLKNDGKGVVLDLGHDVLRIPKVAILKITKDAAASEDVGKSEQKSFYKVADAKRLTTEDAVAKYGRAVVVVKTPGGLGSGLFVDEKGYLLTNFHVIKGQKHVSVTRFVKEGRRLKRGVHKDVEIVATDPFLDLAVLRAKGLEDAVTSVIFQPKEDVRIGETVFAIGNPLGLERTVTEGVVSQTSRNFGGMLYLQIDAPVNPGNSGGPLFNDRGQVIGVINMKVPTMEGLNFAIPARHVTYMLDHLDAYAYDTANPESGYVYPDPPPRFGKKKTKSASAKDDKKDAVPAGQKNKRKDKKK